MEIIRSFNHSSNQPIALTIGNFDGVHLGHRSIIQSLKTKASDLGYQSAVMTFNPHAKVFFKKVTNFLIDSHEEKLARIAEYDTDLLYCIDFDHNFSIQSAEQFVMSLIHQLNVKYLLVGDDFRFGYKGQGNFELLKLICDQHQVIVEDTQTIVVENNRVSSSRIRKMIRDNAFDLIEKLLGRPYSYTGKVIKGRQLGRTIGFPTANLAIDDTRIIPYGVFAVKVWVKENQQMYDGMCNIGHNPTITDCTDRKLEVHLFDFHGDLYHKTLTITPTKKIRNILKFESVEALKYQLVLDKQQVLNHLS